MKKLILNLFMVFCPFLLLAQSWQQTEGAYARIEYMPRLESLADSILVIADQAIPRLAAEQGVPISSFQNVKAHIILTDSPDISNGFAISNTVVIYARSSSYLKYWSGPHRWYKMVLEHELAHQVSFRAVWRKANYFGLVASASVPRWFLEGIAQYLAETWTAYRGDVFLKRAVLNGRFSYSSLSDLSNGRLLYAAGHAYVRYLASQFGDSSLIKLMQFDSDNLYYDFDNAFYTVYGKSPQDLFPYFARHLIIYYGNRAADFPQPKFTSSMPSFGYKDDQVIPLNGADSTYIVSTVVDKNHLYRTAAEYNITKGVIHKVRFITDNYDTELFVSANQNQLAFGRYALGVSDNQQYLAYDWFVYDRTTGKTRLWADNIRAINAAFDADGRLLLSVVEADSSFICRFLKNGKVETLYRTNQPIGSLQVDDAENILFEMQRPDNRRDLFALHNGRLKPLTNTAEDIRKFVVLDKRYLAFNGIKERNPAIWILDKQAGKSVLKINGQFPLKLEGFDRSHKSLLFSYIDPGNKRTFVSMPRDSILKASIVPQKFDPHPAYSDWIDSKATTDSIPGRVTERQKVFKRSKVFFPQGNLVNGLSLALPYKEPNSDWGVLLTTAWIEPMQRQVLALNALIYPSDWENSLVSLGHTLKIEDMDLQSFYYHGPTIFSSFNNQYLALTHDVLALRLGVDRFVAGNRRLPYTLFAGYAYTNIHDPGTSASYHYQGPSLFLSIAYQKPSRYFSIFPKREFKLSTEIFKSVSNPYNFSVLQLHGTAGTNLYLEELGMLIKGGYIQSNGSIPAAGVTGLDRYFNFDLPRDYRYTHTVRGIDRDILGDRLFWGSASLSYYLARNSGLTLLFLPISDVAISAFVDIATVQNHNLRTGALGYGGELSFGYPGMRFAAGYAQGVLAGLKQKAIWYGRLSLDIESINGSAIH